ILYTTYFILFLSILSFYIRDQFSFPTRRSSDLLLNPLFLLSDNLSEGMRYSQFLHFLPIVIGYFLFLFKYSLRVWTHSCKPAASSSCLGSRPSPFKI